MSYIYNPKVKDSGIICCIPQSDTCSLECEGCFFTSGRSYLEPLADNLPNMPTVEQVGLRVVKVNDGNDSGVNTSEVIAAVCDFPLKFYNTSLPYIHHFDAPVVLTVNPGKKTDKDFYKLENQPDNLMFVRARVNTWNTKLINDTVDYYTSLSIPIVLTFMAYQSKESIPVGHQKHYMYRKRTTNKYYAIRTTAWENIMSCFSHSHQVYSCGKVEGLCGTTACAHCGNCLREFFVTAERMGILGSSKMKRKE